MPRTPPVSAPIPGRPDLPTQAFGDPSSAVSDPPGQFLGNYDLLEELGRGGMGVVFKARHRSLNRIVALKMILTGQLASADDVRRFRTEAEAAALLDHPNIVPVYEVGEEGGQHYFACKLIEGGGLSQEIPRLLKDAKETARLLAKVARAVDHAHQRGILHRDLKPANILLDAQGEPHVADFGLARRAGDAGQTQSGAIVGTPGYMAPEQARAEKGLTTSIDVYSLGAILYECLTGKPPFQADTALETILQVIENEPAAPSALNPKVDPELEAVCLKCLAKDPAQRYKSAAALADDLERWLVGEAVSARPPSTLGRLRQWLRKDFRIAALTILVGGVLGILFSVGSWFTLVMAATKSRNLYAASFPSERPPALALWWSVGNTGSAPLDTKPTGALFSWRQLLFLLAITCGGLLNALVLRPRTMATALSLGLAAGLVAGVFSLFFGFALLSTKSPAFGPMQADLLLLASGHRAESLQRQAAQQGRESAALSEWAREAEKQRPDLLRDSLPPEERATVLAEKIDLDLQLNLQVFLWFCLTVVGVVIFNPVVAQTVLAHSLATRGDRGFQFFLHYMEVAVPGSLLLVAGGFLLTGPVLNVEGATWRLLALLGWFVLGSVLWDQVLGWQRTWRTIAVGLWLLAGLGLAVSYFYLVLNSFIANAFLIRVTPVITISAMATAAAIYGIFVKRWRWYIRFAVYLGIVLVAAAVIYFVMR